MSNVNISTLTHPDYQHQLHDWIKWRYTYESGTAFIMKYLKQFTNREDPDDFCLRRDMTYCPAFAKAALDEVKNSIYQRMADVAREGGSKKYRQACEGGNGGVDLCGSSMNYYIGCNVLEEMLKMKKVGVYVDMPSDVGQSLADSAHKHPYLYTYITEDIRAWKLDDSEDPTQFQSVLLRDHCYEYDAIFGFPINYVERYRRIWKEAGKVYFSFYNPSGVMVDKDGQPTQDPVVLNLPMVPFVLFEISDSLMKNISNYQIALLNLASADMIYALKANFPFYVEQYEPRMKSQHLRPEGDGTAEGANTSTTEEVKMGVAKGRRYPKGLDAPKFIHPSSEPMTASMEKQDQLKGEIRQLVGLALANLKGPRMASAESKAKDEASLESGLSYIGMTLENGERKIAEIWSAYEGEKVVATVNYPETYTLRTEQDRRTESEQLGKLLPLVPSITYQKTVGKKLATTLLAASSSKETMDKIYGEIDKSPGFSSDPITIASDIQNGLVSTETASQLRGYPEGEAKKAEKDHADRLKRIQDAQAPKSPIQDGQARGIQDQGGDPLAGKNEKQGQKDPTTNDTGKVPVRGKGQPTAK
jgi:hypothetical protein